MNPVAHARQRLRIARRQRRARALDRKGRHEEAAIQRARSVEGWFTSTELSLLYRSVQRASAPGALAEIGSWKGRSTALIAQALRDAGRTGAKIFAIDPHVGSEEHRGTIAAHGPTLAEFRANLRRLGLEGQVEELVLMSADAADVLRERGERLCFLLIDGAHDYASVQQDIRLFLPLMGPGGIVAFHDCEPEGHWPEVWQAFQDELAPRAEVLGHENSLLVVKP